MTLSRPRSPDSKHLDTITTSDALPTNHRSQHNALDALYVGIAKRKVDWVTDKTRLIEFGRIAAKARSGRGQPKPETFDFLGGGAISPAA
jgi:hypothetical protein